MRERVYYAMFAVWQDECRNRCRATLEFGTAYGLPGNARFICSARVKGTTDLFAGIWHARPAGAGEWEIMNEKVFSPPVHRETLPFFYKTFLSFEASKHGDGILLYRESQELDAIKAMQ